MTKHKLPDGQIVIDELLRLGKVLGYAVHSENPVSKKDSPPTVDVAWMQETNQQFPLMIFEVESLPTNSSAYNPVKVFGSKNTEFEKPLFFFHIFLSGEKSSRITDLQSCFGSYNYRVYCFTRGEVKNLLCDILSQHRRVSATLDFLSLGEFLNNSFLFRDYVKIITPHAISLKFESDVILQLAQLCIKNNIFEPFLQERIASLHSEQDTKKMYPNYSTYFGSCWSTPIHFGLLQYWTHDSTGKWLSRLQRWQEGSLFPSEIGPHFGLSRDYDIFIHTLAPPFLGLIAALMKSDHSAGEYIFLQCSEIFKVIKTRTSDYSVFWALWMLHIASAHGLVDQFEDIRSYLNQEIRSVPENFIYQPPGFLTFQSDQEPDRLSDIQSEPTEVPNFEIFKSELIQSSTKFNSP